MQPDGSATAEQAYAFDHESVPTEAYAFDHKSDFTAAATHAFEHKANTNKAPERHAVQHNGSAPAESPTHLIIKTCLLLQLP